MAFVYGDRIRVFSTTSGTGTLSLGSAVDGFQSFTDGGISDGDSVTFVIENNNNFELSTGTFTASGSTLTRTLKSSSTGSLLNLSGTSEVFISPHAEHLLFADGSGVVNLSGTAPKINIEKPGNGEIEIGYDTSGTFQIAVDADNDESFSAIRLEVDGSTHLYLSGAEPAIVVSQDLFFQNTATKFTFEGSTADNFETVLNWADPSQDNTITLPDASGTIITTGNLSDIAELSTFNVTSHISFEGNVADSFQTSLYAVNPTADRTIDLPNASGEIVLTNGSTGYTTIEGTQPGLRLLDSSTNHSDVRLEKNPNDDAWDLHVDYSQAANNSRLTFRVDNAVYLAMSQDENLFEKDLRLFGSTSILFEGTTDDIYETKLTSIDATADRTISLPDESGTVALLNGFGNLDLKNNALQYEGSTADGAETFVYALDPSTDRSIYFPDKSGVIVVTESGVAEILDETDGTDGAKIRLKHDSASPAVNDEVGAIQVYANDSSGTARVSSNIRFNIDDLGSNYVGGNIQFWPMGLASGNYSHLTIRLGRSEFYSDVHLGLNKKLSFEGATSNSFETTLTVEDPTADREISFPDKSGDVAIVTPYQGSSYIEIKGEGAGSGSATSTGFLQLQAGGTTMLKLNAQTAGYCVIGSFPYFNGVVTYNDLHLEANRSIDLKTNNFGTINFDADAILLEDHVLSFMGATTNSNKTNLTVVDPSQNNTISLPDSSGTVVLESANGELSAKQITVLGDGDNGDILGLFELDVDDTATQIANVQIKPGPSNNHAELRVFTTNVSSGYTAFGADGGVGYMKSASANPLEFHTNDTLRMTISATGDVTTEGMVYAKGGVEIGTDNFVRFEGATLDSYETTLQAVDPTADRTIELPNKSGTLPIRLSDEAFHELVTHRIYPNTSNVYDLGKTDQLWSTVYSHQLNARDTTGGLKIGDPGAAHHSINVTTATGTRTVTIPDASGIFVLQNSDEQTVASLSTTEIRNGSSGELNLKYGSSPRLRVFTSGVQIYNDLVLTSGVVKPNNVREATATLGTSSGTKNIDFEDAGYQYVTMSGNTTFTFNSGGTTENGQSVVLRIIDNGNIATWPSMTWVNGSAPDLTTNGTTFIFILRFASTWYGFELGGF